MNNNTILGICLSVATFTAATFYTFGYRIGYAEGRIKELLNRIVSTVERTQSDVSPQPTEANK